MNILIIAYYAQPDNNGGVKRPEAFAKGLANFGHKVTILTHGHSMSASEDNKYRILDLYDRNGIFAKTKVFIHKVVKRLRLLFGSCDTYYSDWRGEVINKSDDIIKKINPDLIIASYPPVECLELGVYFSEKYKIRLIADYRDPLIDESAEKIIIEKYPQMYEYFNKVEQSVIKNSEKILVIAPSMKKYYEHLCKDTKVILLPNGYDSKLKTIQLPNIYLNKFIIGYTGTISHFDPDRDLSEFFSAIREGLDLDPVIFKKIEVRLYGNISQDDLGEYIDLVDRGHVKIMGVVTMDESIRLQSEFNALLVITGVNRKCVATGKVFEYLASGRPIIALTKNTFAEEIIKSTATGVCISPRDKIGIYKLLKSAATTSQIFYDPNFNEVGKYDRANQIEILNNIIKM